MPYRRPLSPCNEPRFVRDIEPFQDRESPWNALSRRLDEFGKQRREHPPGHAVVPVVYMSGWLSGRLGCIRIGARPAITSTADASIAPLALLLQSAASVTAAVQISPGFKDGNGSMRRTNALATRFRLLSGVSGGG